MLSDDGRSRSWARHRTRRGLPVGVAGLQIDRRCGSGLQAVIYAAMQVATGASEIVLAGGAESMSSAVLLEQGSLGSGRNVD